jgi:hypothetical protein
MSRDLYSQIVLPLSESQGKGEKESLNCEYNKHDRHRVVSEDAFDSVHLGGSLNYSTYPVSQPNILVSLSARGFANLVPLSITRIMIKTLAKWTTDSK